MNFFRIELSDSIICVDGFLKVQMYSNLDTANVLKTKILPARDSPLGSQALITSFKGFRLPRKFSFSTRSVS